MLQMRARKIHGFVPHFRLPSSFLLRMCTVDFLAAQHGPSAAVPGNAFFPRSRRLPLFGLSRPADSPLHGPVCQRSVRNPRVRPGRALTLQTLEPVAGSPAAAGRWRGCAEQREWLPSPAGRHGGPVSQLRVGSIADPVADRANADGVLWLAGPVAGAGGRAGAQQPFAGPDVRRGDPGLFHPSRPALNDVLRPQRPHLCPGLAVLHPAREAVSGFHCDCAFLSPPGLLALQLPLPLGADLVAGPGCVHCAHGRHRGIPVHADGTQGDPPQLSP